MGKYLNRRSDGAINSPPLNKDPRSKRSWGDAYVRSPMLQRLCDAIVRQVECVSPVVILRVGCRPSAVSRSVVSVNVNSVNGATIRPVTHVGKEVFKPQPTAANGNSTASVELETISLWVGAAVNHCAPRLIDRVFASAVRCSPLGAFFSGKAPAGLLAFFDVVAGNYCGVPAIAKAAPFNGNASPTMLGYITNNKPAKSLTAKVKWFSSAHSALLNVKHLKVHGKQRCGCGSGATLAMQGVF